MIIFEAVWTGIDELVDEELKRLRIPMEAAVLKAELHLENAVKLKLTGPRSGRIYGDHQASAPGEPPATWHGDLRKSITHTIPAWIGDEISGQVFTNSPYAKILEFGGIAGNGARILPRPYLESTFVEEEDALNDILSEAAQS